MVFGGRVLGAADGNMRHAALPAAVLRRARASIQIPRRASRSLTLVSEKRIIDLI
jgi:hypothetical protein